jgi:monoamine oxidase
LPRHRQALAEVFAIAGTCSNVPDTSADVVVVGAGLSGLAAARQLSMEGFEVCVLEARERVGGRTLNADLGQGKVVEVGGQFVGPGQEAILRVAHQLGVATFPTHDQGLHQLELGGRLRRHDGTVPRLSLRALLAYQHATTHLNRLAQTVPPEAPWTAPIAHELDATTAAAWARAHIRSKPALKLFEIAVRAVWSFDPADVSLLHLLACINAGQSLETLVRTTGGAQQDRFVGGSQEISLRLAADLPRPPLLNHPVRRIAQDSLGVTVYAEGLSVSAQRVIVALPPMLAQHVEFSPRMPAGREQLLSRMPQGTTIKCLAVYDEPFWRKQGLSGQTASDQGPVSSTFDNSPPEGEPGILLGFVVAAHARRLLALTERERREAVLRCFARWYGARAMKPKRFIVGSWSEEPWTRGCYAGYLVPGAWTAFGPWLRQPHRHVHWAGTETATKWIGFMDGAITAGERAATEVAAALAEQSPEADVAA